MGGTISRYACFLWNRNEDFGQTNGVWKVSMFIEPDYTIEFDRWKLSESQSKIKYFVFFTGKFSVKHNIGFDVYEKSSESRCHERDSWYWQN